MESTGKKHDAPKLWYWGESKEGMSIEECEMIARSIPRFERKRCDLELHISFV